MTLAAYAIFIHETKLNLRSYIAWNSCKQGMAGESRNRDGQAISVNVGKKFALF